MGYGYDFWDIAGPLSLIIFAISIAISIWAFIKKSIWTLVICVLIGSVVVYITLWSIGKYIAVFVIMQLIGTLYLLFKGQKK
ncbi:hypothetical protein [Thermoactinomyces sp. CICC 10522]|jgi:hypothetical protein|uniref:hypothetical protein n=1 Tax=Thermoactinomyces sp. CICC 10522 TaxID=2767427 RepID=UPI0018DEB5A6|nr:hypothetical protein [Thermoactinomyces sp. CICC 10522]MBH8604107.1 hypothetical protein [Thermoactinomyces sp. CICC 10522]